MDNYTTFLPKKNLYVSKLSQKTAVAETQQLETLHLPLTREKNIWAIKINISSGMKKCFRYF